jgi:hypothetical protein
MPTSLASTVFNTGAKDKLAALDVYNAKGQGSAVINSIQSLAKSAGLNLGGLLSKAAGANSLFSSINGKLSLSASALTDRLMGSAGSMRSDFTALSNDVKTKFTSAFAAQTGMAKDKLSLAYGEAGQFSCKIDAAAYENITAFSGLVNNHLGTNDFSVIDKTALGSLNASIISQGASLGIPNMFSAVTSAIEDVTVLNATVKESVPSLAAQGDIASLLDISTNDKVKSTIGILFPDFGRNIATNYSVLTSENPTQRESSWTNLITLFTNVDSNWDQFNRRNGGEVGVSILSLLGASNDFKVLVQAGLTAYNLHVEANREDRRFAYALSTVYRQTTVAEELKRFFPRLVLEATMTKYGSPYGNALNSHNNKPIDPRVIGLAGKLLAGVMG